MNQSARKLRLAGPVNPARRAIGTGGKDQLARAQRNALSFPGDLNQPFACCRVIFGRVAAGGLPDVQLEQVCIGLQPVTHFVFRRENRPVFREGQIGQVIVPDRVMQHEATVAVAPTVARAGILFHDQRGHTQLPQPGTKGYAALPAADDQDIGLVLLPHPGHLGITRLTPSAAVPVGFMGNPLGPRRTAWLLVALQIRHRCQKRVTKAVLQRQPPGAVGRGRLEADPGRGRIAFGFRLAGYGPVRRRRGSQSSLKHGDNGGPSLHRLDVPCEGQKVAPKSIGLEQRYHGRNVGPDECCRKRGNPVLGGKSHLNLPAVRWSGRPPSRSG